MMRAYMDESGHEGGTVCVVAGFVGSKDAWENCADAWVQGLGRKKSLHMSGLRWKEDKTRRLLARLGPIPAASGLKCIAATVRHADYQKIVRPLVRDRFAKPWMLAFHMAFTRTLKWLPKNEPIKSVFEQQREYAPYVNVIHRLVFAIRKRDPRVLAFDFVPKGATHCTEPADYLAFMLRESEINPESQKAKMGESMLSSNQQCIGDKFTRPMVKEWADDMLKNKADAKMIVGSFADDYGDF